MNIFNPEKYPIELCMFNLFITTAIADYMVKKVIVFLLGTLI